VDQGKWWPYCEGRSLYGPEHRNEYARYVVDVHSPEQRARNMAAIRSTGTKPEMKLRRALHAAGYRFTVNVRDLPGRPDLVFSKRKTAIFVNGCFWHSHSCKWGQTVPATNEAFWITKRNATVSRDSRNIIKLHDAGWRTLTVWECELRLDGEILSDVKALLGPPRS
jgi:DNA mismatch endonuclease (patch repair protein)